MFAAQTPWADFIKYRGYFKMKVVCLNNTNMERVLTVGGIYQVLKVGVYGDELMIIADDGEVWRCHIKRFEFIK